MVRVIVPTMLAAQAAGQRHFDVEASTVGEALHALPVADLLFDHTGGWNRWLLVYVDDDDSRERGGLACPLLGVQEIRVIAMLAGG
jgi:hypothetical protein